MVLFFLQLIVTVVEDAHQLELVVLRLYVFHDHRVNTPDGRKQAGLVYVLAGHVLFTLLKRSVLFDHLFNFAVEAYGIYEQRAVQIVNSFFGKA